MVINFDRATLVVVLLLIQYFLFRHEILDIMLLLLFNTGDTDGESRCVHPYVQNTLRQLEKSDCV